MSSNSEQIFAMRDELQKAHSALKADAEHHRTELVRREGKHVFRSVLKSVVGNSHGDVRHVVLIVLGNLNSVIDIPRKLRTKD